MSRPSEPAEGGAWERFMGGEPVDGAVSAAILESWQRSRAAAVDHERPTFRRVSEQELQRRLEDATAVREIATAHLRWFSAALAPLWHAVYLVDADGIVLDAAGEPPELRVRAGLEPGFDWSERQMGTNGAGTALASRGPIAVLGGQHFCREWHDTTCVGAPIFGPERELLGAIDLTTSAADGHVARLPAVQHIVYTIERELELRHKVAQTRASELAERLARSRSERMSEVLSAFSRALSPNQVVSALLAEGLSALDAEEGALWVLAPDGRSLERVGIEGGARDDAHSPRGSLPIEATAPAAEAVRRQVLVLFDSPDAWLRHYLPAAGGTVPPNGSRGAVPLLMGGQCFGALEFGARTWRAFDTDDRQLVSALAAQCAQALERARLFEAERRARSVAEQALAAREELLALVSHHVRTPLAVIATSAALILDELSALDAGVEPARSQVVQILDASERVEMLTRNLLHLGRLDTGRTGASLTRCPLSALLQDAVKEQAPLALRKRQQLTWHAEAELTVLCDGELTTHVLRNLLENAIKFCADGAAIEVRAQRVEKYARICVVDQGPGISSADLPRIFEPYFQAAGSSRRGVGLGLHIVRRFLEAQGSAVQVESAPGVGSRFCFELPLAE